MQREMLERTTQPVNVVTNVHIYVYACVGVGTYKKDRNGEAPFHCTYSKSFNGTQITWECWENTGSDSVGLK